MGDGAGGQQKVHPPSPTNLGRTFDVPEVDYALPKLVKIAEDVVSGAHLKIWQRASSPQPSPPEEERGTSESDGFSPSPPREERVGERRPILAQPSQILRCALVSG